MFFPESHPNGGIYRYPAESCPFFRLHSSFYFIEPGQKECRAYLVNKDGTGGIGSRGTVFCHDFFLEMGLEGGRSYPGSIYDFLESAMIEIEHADCYYTLSLEKVISYMWQYLDLYLSASFIPNAAASMVNLVYGYIEQRPPREAACTGNLLIGDPYFNDLFYVTSYQAASWLFEPLDLTYLSNSLDRLPHKLEFSKFFVNMFDDRGDHGFEFVDDPRLISFVKGDRTGATWRCTRDQYERSFLPYILFLSTWTPLLATALCVNVFGQCAIRYVSRRDAVASAFR